MNKYLIAMAFSLLSLFSFNQNKPFTSMTVDEFATLIADTTVQRLDVRTQAEYDEAHIPEAMNIDVKKDDFLQVADSLLDKTRPVALYCRSGVRSKKAAAILAKNGYKVYELDKGFLSWQEAGK